MTKVKFKRLLATCFPFLILLFSLFFLFRGDYFFVWGLVVFSLAIDSIVDLSVIGVDEPEDERIKHVKNKSADFSYRLTASSIVVFVVIHNLYTELDASFILNFLLLVAFLSYPIMTSIINKST
ncbi:hypothetical protein [Alteribacter populi]|uniref:hypothetical protein n=1 Tax=Alteribacter populi TaxID=2011011 RepID=UPI000BBA5EE0|nr:hypothetical protein [Alteribacter populi]